MGSPLNYEKRSGSYKCANCEAVLFTSRGKYDSESGWPSFYRTAGGGNDNDDSFVALKEEWDGRTEISCRTCGGHLGHVFMDGPRRADLAEKDVGDVPSTDPPPRGQGPGS